MTTKYEYIKRDIINEIRNGIFEPGDKLYTENELKHRYNVSSITVVKALQELVSEGYVVRYQGKGTFVSKRKRKELTLFSDLEFSPKDESVKVLNIEVIPATQVPIDRPEAHNFLKITRVKNNGGVPYNYIVSMIPEYLIDPSNINKDKLLSVYDRVFQDSGMDLLHQHYQQRVSIAFPAPKVINSTLKLNGGPAVKQEMKNYDEGQKLVEYTVSYKRWDYYTVMLESSK